MDASIQQERFFEALIAGDRPTARTIVQETLSTLESPVQLTAELFWPAYEHIEKLFRKDQLALLAHHCGTKLLRVLVDQNAARCTMAPPLGRSVIAFCGQTDSDELGAQMGVDLLEASGFEVTFCGSGVPNDEIMERVHEARPEVLLMFAAGPGDLPNLRRLIDDLHGVGACPDLQIVVGGGVFTRADGLAEELGSDLWASNPMDLAHQIYTKTEHRAPVEQRTVGKRRSKRSAA